MKKAIPGIMLALIFLLAMAVVCTGSLLSVSAANAPASLTPTPEPPTPTPTPEPGGWDRSSLSVEGACVERKAQFTITNTGADMQGPAYYWFLNMSGGAATCLTSVAHGYLYSGTVTLQADALTVLQFDTAGIEPPYRLCVEQRPGHPGVGWASATAEPSDECRDPTALDEVAEPMGPMRVFLVWLRGEVVAADSE